MLGYQAVIKAIEAGQALEMCKYKYDGKCSAWKAVSAEVALHKVEVQVCGYDYDSDEEVWFCPYRFRLA